MAMRQHAPLPMDWNELLQIAVYSVIFGVLVAWGRRLYARLTPRAGAPAALALVLGLFLAVVYGLYRSPVGSAYRESVALQQEQDRLQREQQRLAQLGEAALKPVLEAPEFQQRIQGMSAEQVRELTMELAAQGQMRLSNARLVRRMQLLGEAVERSSDSACAATLLSMTSAQLLQVLAVLPDASLREWMELSAEAVLAALHEAPAHASDPSEAQRAREALLAALPEPDRERFAAALANPTQLGVADACWASRTLYRTAVKLAPDDTALVARVLATR